MRGHLGPDAKAGSLATIGKGLEKKLLIGSIGRGEDAIAPTPGRDQRLKQGEAKPRRLPGSQLPRAMTW